MPTIEVITYSKNDYERIDLGEPEDDTPEAAITTARTLLQDALNNGVRNPRAALYVNGRMVRCDIRIQDISSPQFDCDWAFRDPMEADRV